MTTNKQVSRMISHSIKLFPETVAQPAVTFTSTVTKKEQVQWTRAELEKYIDSLKTRGYEIGKELNYKWGNKGTLVGFKDTTQNSNYLLDKHHPDVMIVKSYNSNIAPSILYNDTEVLLPST